MNLSVERTTYAILLGYWDDFFGGLYPRASTNDLTGREFEQLMVQPRKTVMPAPESEHPRKYNPSEREIQYNLDLVKRVLTAEKEKIITFSSQNPAG